MSIVNRNDQLHRDISIKGFYCSIFLETLFQFSLEWKCADSPGVKKKKSFPHYIFPRGLFLLLMCMNYSRMQ